MSLLFPNTVENLLDGPVRVLIAPLTEAVPAGIHSVIDMESPYDPVGSWRDLGATSDSTDYERDMSSEEYFIEQETVAVLEKITEVTRGITIPLAEITPENIQLIEESPDASLLAAAANRSAQDILQAGTIESLTRYRLAWIAQRDPGFGMLVTESADAVPASGARGAFVAGIGYNVAIAAEGSSHGIQKGELSSREVALRFFGESTIADTRKNQVMFAFEREGTIAAAP